VPETVGPKTVVPGAVAEWRQNWKVVAAAAVGMGLLSVPTYSMGIFMKPIEDTFGWSRAAISASHLLGHITGIVLAPLIGLVASFLFLLLGAYPEFPAKQQVPAKA
jgi:hypothetical protein